jgi:peptide/nickel transport system permease protein
MSKILSPENQRFEEAPPKVNEIRRFFRSMFSRWITVLGAIIFMVLIITAIFAPLIAPYEPNKQTLKNALAQPSSEHLLGTDELGRDVLSRIVFGSRISLMVGLIVTGVAGFFGTLLGLIAGYGKKFLNNIIMRIIDAMMAVPALVLALAIGAALGGGFKNILISLGIAMIPGYCRLMCAQVLTIKENDYILAANSLGAKYQRILFGHILPNAFPPLLVLVTFNMGTAILAEAGLSFLGIGISPPDAAWGSMVNSGYKYLITNPLLSIAPGIAIIFVVVALNLVGDGLRDALDPKLKGII